MPRVLGVDIPGEKRAEYSLRYVYGIGATRARQVVEEAEIPADLRAKDLTDQQINRIIGVIQRNRGIRHRKSLPVRGQRTSTNARTRKGPRKTVGIIRSKETKAAKT